MKDDLGVHSVTLKHIQWRKINGFYKNVFTMIGCVVCFENNIGFNKTFQSLNSG